MEYKHVTHTFDPVFDENSRILILGSFPSVKSREGQFYYHHPQNRFWKILAALTKQEVPQTIEEKKQMLLKNNIAIWDVIASCDIIGSSDSSIKNVVPADIQGILQKTKIQRIYTNGGKAYRLYKKYCGQKAQKEVIKLSSSSPANAANSLEKLIQAWGEVINPYLSQSVSEKCTVI